jgi:NADH-quinone oxidoreductase subunit M
MLLVPVLACLVIAWQRPSSAKPVALAAVAINAVLSLIVYGAFPTTGTGVYMAGYQFETNVPFVQVLDFFTINFHIGVDGINLPLVLLTTIVSLSAIAVAPAEIKRAREFFICLLLVSAGALGAFLSLDVFFLYIAHEIALIPTFLLIGIWGTHDRKFAATQITLYLAGGSMVLLAGIIGLYLAIPSPQQSFDLTQLNAVARSGALSPFQQNIIFPLLLVGFGSLVSLWPFHSWAAPAYASAPAPAVMLHAGVLKKFGLYGLIRLAIPFLPEGFQTYGHLVMILLLFNVIYIGLVTIAQKDLSLLLGYSSVMHMGYLFLGLISLNVIGLSGMVVLMVAHGLSAALLFGLASVIREKFGTLHLKEMGGLATKAPILAFLFIVGAMASIGLPGLGNFPGEILILFGAWRSYPLGVILCAWGVVISAVYMLRAVRDICFGETAPALGQTLDLGRFGQRWPYVILVAALLCIGVCPRIITDLAEPSIILLLGGSF